MDTETISPEVLGAIIAAISTIVTALITATATYIFMKRRHDADIAHINAEITRINEETKNIQLDSRLKEIDIEKLTKSIFNQADIKNKKITIDKKGSETYFYFDKFGSTATGIVYKEAQSIIEKAKKEVMVLWAPSQYKRTSEDERSAEWKFARNEYYKSLLSKCENNQKFRYSRYLQMPESYYKWSDNNNHKIKGEWILDSGYRAHCKNILSEKLKNAKLFYTKQISHETFVIVDGRIILIEVDVHDYENKTSEFQSVIVIEDPTGSLVNNISSTFFNFADKYAQPVNQITKVVKSTNKKHR